MAAEIVKGTVLPPADIRRRVRIVNLEEPQALLARGQSVLLVAAHQGNWEWMLLALSLDRVSAADTLRLGPGTGVILSAAG